MAARGVLVGVALGQLPHVYALAPVELDRVLLLVEVEAAPLPGDPLEAEQGHAGRRHLQRLQLLRVGLWVAVTISPPSQLSSSSLASFLSVSSSSSFLPSLLGISKRVIVGSTILTQTVS